jgi:hypothetical protein
MNCIAIIKSSGSNLKQPSKILSGGDEKVLRIFEAPYNYVRTLNNLSAFEINLHYSTTISNSEVEQQMESEAKK